MTQEILFATGNAHKVGEVQQILGPSYTIKSLKDLGYDVDIPEDGKTMAENALIKARYLHQRLGLPVVAEDSGLEAIALGMAPGIYTARYAGPERDNDANIDLLLANLAGKADRSARFRAVVAYIDGDGAEQTFEGIVNGHIAEQRAGAGGFGYDPVFVPYGYDRSFAELPAEVKAGISHRARAFFGLLRWLKAGR